MTELCFSWVPTACCSISCLSTSTQKRYVNCQVSPKSSFPTCSRLEFFPFFFAPLCSIRHRSVLLHSFIPQWLSRVAQASTIATSHTWLSDTSSGAHPKGGGFQCKMHTEIWSLKCINNSSTEQIIISWIQWVKKKSRTKINFTWPGQSEYSVLLAITGQLMEGYYSSSVNQSLSWCSCWTAGKGALFLLELSVDMNKHGVSGSHLTALLGETNLRWSSEMRHLRDRTRKLLVQPWYWQCHCQPICQSNSHRACPPLGRGHTWLTSQRKECPRISAHLESPQWH
jgi:hypothetical protein